MNDRNISGYEHSEATVILAWENIGPTHIDRLAALAAAGYRTIAVEFSSRSNTYAWEGGDNQGFERQTLFPASAVPSAPRLWYRLLRACLRVKSARILLCHYEVPAVLGAALVLRLLGRRVFTMVDSKFDDYPRQLWRELMKSLFLLPYSGALTASHRSRDYLRFLGIPADRIMLGYDTLSVDRIAALSGSPPAPDGMAFADRDFVVVARQVPKKNIALAIDAYALWLRAAGKPRNLHLCGSGPLEADLRAQVARAGLEERVHFHGFVQTKAVSQILSRALCLLLPSSEEQYGLVIVEAQAMGLPVLASSNAGACDTLIDPGLNGFILKPDDPAGWAAVMALVSEDEMRWRRLALATRDGRYRGDCRHFVEGVQALTDGR